MDLKKMEQAEAELREAADRAINNLAHDARRIVEETAAAVRAVRELPQTMPQLMHEANAVFVTEMQPYEQRDARITVAIGGNGAELGAVVVHRGERFRVVVALYKLPAE